MGAKCGGGRRCGLYALKGHVCVGWFYFHVVVLQSLSDTIDFAGRSLPNDDQQYLLRGGYIVSTDGGVFCLDWGGVLEFVDRWGCSESVSGSGWIVGRFLKCDRVKSETK